MFDTLATRLVHKTENWQYFLKIIRVILRIPEQIVGLRVLIHIHFYKLNTNMAMEI